MGTAGRTRRFAAVATLLFLGLPMAGCGGDDAGSSSAASRPDTVPPSETQLSTPGPDALRGVSFEVRRDPG